MLVLVGGDRGVGAQRAREDEADAALAQDVGDVIARAGLQAGVGDLVKAEGLAVVEGGLLGVPDVELHMVDAVEGHRILSGNVAGYSDGLGAHALHDCAV